MMNYISYLLSDWLLNGPMKAPGFRPLTPVIENSAMLPRFFPDPLRFNWGFFLALAMAALVYWFLFKTTVGFEIRAVGANPDGARYAGMNIVKNFVIAMTLSGALAGLAGATQVLGIDHWWVRAFLQATVSIQSRSPCWARVTLWVWYWQPFCGAPCAAAPPVCSIRRVCRSRSFPSSKAW